MGNLASGGRSEAEQRGAKARPVCRVIQVSLDTADDRAGRYIAQLCRDGSVRSARCKWDRDGDGETVAAVLTQVDVSGNGLESVELSGDEWRALENHGRLDGLLEALFYCRETATVVRSALALDEVGVGNKAA